MVRVYDHDEIHADAWTTPADEPEQADQAEEVDLEKLTKAELRDFAAANDVDLAGVDDRKDALVAALVAALTEPDGTGS